jgi:hypothetical protein
MEHRRLCRTGLENGALGIGTEYLNRRPRKAVLSVILEGIGRGECGERCPFDVDVIARMQSAVEVLEANA